MMNRAQQIACVLLLIPSLAAVAQTPADPQNVDRESLTDLVVQVNNSDGKPIANAAVMVYAMRMEEGGGHGFWNPTALGPPKQIFSGTDGKAIVQYPAKVYQTPQTLTTRLVTFSVNHADYVSETVHFDLGPEVAEVTLKKGCVVQLSAADENGQPLSEFAVLMAGPIAPQFWATDENGGRRTGGASDGTWQTLLVKPQEDGCTLFSTVLPLRVRPNQAVKIRNIRMQPGTHVKGRLSDNVPRPVNNGYVVTTTVPKPQNNSWDEQDPSITWTQWEPINADGTFELKSVPTGGEIQIIALADGWLSKTNVPEARVFVMGQLFDVDEKAMELTVEMERTGSLLVTVNDPEGNPLQEGTLSSWPNQRYYKGGSTMLGMRYNTLDVVKNQLAPPDQQKNPYSRKFDHLPFAMRPISNGKATLSGYPVGKTISIIMQHPEYTIDADHQRLGQGIYRLTIESHEPNDVLLKTKPINQEQ